jgi:uncharacterized protein YbbK (DUF523 family)
MRRSLPTSGRVLVSACLAGRSCAYDGTHRAHPEILKLVREGRAVLVCPEEEGGLPTPRPAAEINGGRGDRVLDGAARVVTDAGDDVTQVYLDGARVAVDRAQEEQCRAAILKARSPACGCAGVYDGTFSRTLQAGDGVTAAALRRAGMELWTEEELSSPDLTDSSRDRHEEG